MNVTFSFHNICVCDAISSTIGISHRSSCLFVLSKVNQLLTILKFIRIYSMLIST
ncbi:uncharacterized protein DS421_11g341890 [Arachis hypogaea]|nr:uncharacterized protein DS421_11g341890 [Arachis hypogaea]